MKPKTIGLAALFLMLGVVLFLFRNVTQQAQNRSSNERALNSDQAAVERQKSVPVRPAEPGERKKEELP